MPFALSSRWNSRRHKSGETMVEEILGLGISHLELGYDFTRDLAAGVQKMVREGAVAVVSVHNYCPVPMGVPRGHPELWTLADPDERVRAKAVEHTTATIRFAAEMGARAVVVHAGNVRMRPLTRRLIALTEKGREGGWWGGRVRLALETRREKKVPAQLEHLYRGLEKLLPVLQETGVRIGLENLPSWEAIPTETEMLELAAKFASEHIGAWHDFGHGQIRENLGFTVHGRMLERLLPHVVGFHIHDVAPPATDHLVPSFGQMDFTQFRDIMKQVPDLPRVLEPTRDVPRDALITGLKHLRDAWEAPPAPTATAEGARGSFYG